MKKSNLGVAGLLLTAILAGAGGVAFAVRSSEHADTAQRAADNALKLATKDHDAITRLETLMPRLEKAIEKLENRK